MKKWKQKSAVVDPHCPIPHSFSFKYSLKICYNWLKIGVRFILFSKWVGKINPEVVIFGDFATAVENTPPPLLHQTFISNIVIFLTWVGKLYSLSQNRRRDLQFFLLSLHFCSNFDNFKYGCRDDISPSYTVKKTQK